MCGKRSSRPRRGFTAARTLDGCARRCSSTVAAHLAVGQVEDEGALGGAPIPPRAAEVDMRGEAATCLVVREEAHRRHRLAFARSPRSHPGGRPRAPLR